MCYSASNMKFRYIVRTFVEASSPQEAIRLAKKIKPHEVFLDDRVWEKREFSLEENKPTQIGFSKRRK